MLCELWVLSRHIDCRSAYGHTLSGMIIKLTYIPFVAFTRFANLTCAGFLPVNVLKRVNIFKRNMSPFIHLTQAKYSCNHGGMSFTVWPVFVGDFSLRLPKKDTESHQLLFCTFVDVKGKHLFLGLSKVGNTSVNQHL